MKYLTGFEILLLLIFMGIAVNKDIKLCNTLVGPIVIAFTFLLFSQFVAKNQVPLGWFC